MLMLSKQEHWYVSEEEDKIVGHVSYEHLLPQVRTCAWLAKSKYDAYNQDKGN